MRVLAGALAVIWAAFTGVAMAQPADLGEAEAVVITGEREGPRVWRATKDGREIVILGALSPLPRGVTWRSPAVERLVGESDIVMPDQVTLALGGVGPLEMVRLMIDIRSLSRNAEGARLRDVLPSDLHARFSALRRRYGQDDQEWERLRPFAAAAALREEAFERERLQSASVPEQIERLAKRADVPWSPVRIEHRGDVRAIIKQASANVAELELACLRETVEMLEQDMPNLRARATAWARGDVAALRRLPTPPQRLACANVLRAAPELAALMDQAEARWWSAVEDASAKHGSVFVVASIDRILTGGILRDLEAKGFAIEGP